MEKKTAWIFYNCGPHNKENQMDLWGQVIVTDF